MFGGVEYSSYLCVDALEFGVCDTMCPLMLWGI